MMKKDLKEEKLLDGQLSQVQGGLAVATIIYCLQPGCSWVYNGLVEGVAAAQHAHTDATGHDLFGSCKPADSFGH